MNMKMSPYELAKVEWDSIIVGTGMGGATAGYALAQGGQKVLFLEKGKDYLNNPKAIRGEYIEVINRGRPDQNNDPDVLKNGGRWRGELFDAAHKKYYRPILGTGTGGSTALYGMALERFFPSDFSPKKFHAKDTESTLPERWPVSYEEMRPYYEQAEELFRVYSDISDYFRQGENLRYLKYKPGFPLHIATRRFQKYLTKRGFHPYTVPFACDWEKNCQFCQSILCDKNCKNDAAKICLKPAVEQFHAALLTQFNVERLDTDAGRVTGVTGRWMGKEHLTFRGRRIILAAGALATPLLLLRSKSARWPDGLANESGYVGRNLMRHLIDLYFLPSIWKFSNKSYSLKELAINDFYEVDGVKYGTFQPYGKFPPGFMAADQVHSELEQTAPAWVAKLYGLVKPVSAFFMDNLFKHSGCAVPILEDLPQWDNRVEEMPPGPDGFERISVHYRISRYDAQRLKIFRTMIRKALFPYFIIQIPMADSLKMIAHACGTVRFGDDPQKSVLNKFNRAHSVENLYVVDASYFPSSAGLNPALTLAANALRVAAHILGEK